MAHLSLCCLGAFQAQLDGQPLTGFQSDKARALLIYLAVEAGQPHQRAQLAGLLWSDWPDRTALTYLRHALANLRQILGDAQRKEPFLLVSRSSLAFNQASSHHLDVAELQAALGNLTTAQPGLARLQEAVVHYRRPFLDGFFLDGCTAFEEWVVLLREQIQRQVLEAYQHLAASFEQQGDYAIARRYAQQCVDLEPWLEEAQRRLMRLLALSGERNAALAQYERCRRLLAEGLGVEPAAETTALYEAIRARSLDKTASWPDDKNFRLRILDFGLEDAPTAAGQSKSKIHNLKSKIPAPPHNLPAQPTPLIGRDDECAALQELFRREEARLVTLTGPGGVGKTRLALQVAMHLLDAFADGVFAVFLDAIREPALVILAIAETLAVREAGARPLTERVKAMLRDRQLLLVLDNFEQVAAAAPVVAELLAAAPGLRILVTSRERLHLRGEYEYATPPLPVPAPSAPISPALLACASVELFRQRALAGRHDFTLDDDNAATVAAICARLDGLPLAIELAAAQVRRFTPQALLQRLALADQPDSLRFLQTDLRDAPGRHRSLWATIAWSYQLLATAEQTLCRRLAVFVGSFGPEAAATVCGEGLLGSIADGLAALVDKHLARQIEEVADAPRFMMLETIREFGLEQLQQNNELDTLRQRHAAYYQELVIMVQPELRGPNSAHFVALLRSEYANVRSAFRWSLDQRHVDICLRLCDALLPFWNLGYYKEAEAYLRETLALAEGSPPSATYVNALVSAGFIARALGDITGPQHYFERALAMNKAIGDLGSSVRICIANGLLAWIMFDRGDYQAVAAYNEAEWQTAQAADDRWSMAMALANNGYMAALLGDFDKAHNLLVDALARHREIGQKWGIALTLCHQGYCYVQCGAFEQAERVLAESQALCEEIQATGTLAKVKMNFGLLAMLQGEYQAAGALLTEAIRLLYEVGQVGYVIESLELIARLALGLGQPRRTLVLAGVSVAQRSKLECVAPPPARAALDRAVAAARRQLNTATAAASGAAGEAMTLDEAVAFALWGRSNPPNHHKSLQIAEDSGD
jgi:predicted ATPase/DNA-binding SARP family transcriptional activator